LSFEQAAALPLAGITGYRALFTQGRLESGQVVVISGIGGGVSSLMLAMAVGRGAKVYVTSGSDEKIGAAVADGAIAGVNYRSEDWVEQLQALTESDGIDLVVDSAGGDGFASLVDCLKPGGRLTFFGATLGFPSSLDLRKMFFKQITIQGTTMGNNADFASMIDLVNTLQLHPRVDGPTSIKDIREAYNKMHTGDQFGKLVLTHDVWN
jgi:NADPH:quinone reductase-like Zn-dependent oxidoreductase